MKNTAIIIILVLFLREIFKMAHAIETNAKPAKIITPCVFACIIAILAKLVGNLLTTM